MFFVGEECLEGEGAVVGGNAQGPACEGVPGAEKSEVGGVPPEGATHQENLILLFGAFWCFFVKK